MTFLLQNNSKMAQMEVLGGLLKRLAFAQMWAYLDTDLLADSEAGLMP